MGMKQMERLVGRDGNKGKEQTTTRQKITSFQPSLLFPWYQSILLRLVEVLNHRMHHFIQLSIDFRSVNPTKNEFLVISLTSLWPDLTPTLNIASQKTCYKISYKHLLLNITDHTDDL